MKNTANPTRKTTLSRAAMLARRRELDALNVINAGAFYSAVKRRPDLFYHARKPVKSVRFISLEHSGLPGVRLQRRDVLIARECVSAPRNALVAVLWETGGKERVEVGLWTKGGERVVTLTLKHGDERVFLREELTLIGLVIGYIRREDRRAIKPPVQVFKTGGA